MPPPNRPTRPQAAGGRIARISIIIPAYQAARTLEACLRACLGQTHPDCEVIVVDDGSTDDTGRIAQRFPVHYLRQDNQGPAAARNRGAAHAQGDVLAYTDADCVPEPDWIEALTSRFEEEVGAVGGTYAIANPERLLARMVHEEIAVRHSRFGQNVDFVGSFNVAYARQAFDAAGGFDPAFTAASGEDNDLAYRLADLGYALRYNPHARVAHYHPERLGPYLRAQARHGYWRMKLYAKHPARGRGDQYAGLADLMAPPLALLLPAALLTGPLDALGAPVPAWTHAAFPALLALFAALHLPMPLTMTRRTRDPRMLLFAPVAALRTGARALGMLAGAWRFLIRRRAGA